MLYFLALIPATALTIAGYFVLYLAQRAEGSLRTFGRYLGFWAFTLAGLVVLGAIFAAAHGRHRGPHPGMYGMHERMHCPWVTEGRSWPPRARRGVARGTCAAPRCGAQAPCPNDPCCALTRPTASLRRRTSVWPSR